MQAAVVDSADWDKPSVPGGRKAIPSVNAWEQVISPHGLFKTLYFSIAPDKVETARRVVLRDGFEVLSAGLAIRKMESDEFEWREHPVWKITVPGQYVGHQIKWLEENGFVSTEPWAVKLVWPVNRPPEIGVRFDLDAKDGWDIAIVAVEPLSGIDLSHRVQIESNVVRLAPGFQR